MNALLHIYEYLKCLAITSVTALPESIDYENGDYSDGNVLIDRRED